MVPTADGLPDRELCTVQFNWWDVSSGRYICYTHGGFCGSRDNYVSKCPACYVAPERHAATVVVPNPVARQLDYINSMRDRSRKQVGVILALPPVLLALWKLGGGLVDNKLYLPGYGEGVLLLGSLMWLFSVLLLFYAARNFNVYNSLIDLKAADVCRSLRAWTDSLAVDARQREVLYSISNFLTASGLAFVALTVIPSFLRMISSGH